MPRKHILGDLQLAIMRVLWARGEASAGDVHAALHAERGLAPTTIATMLRKMEEKGLVGHRADGRLFLYRARVAEAKVRHSMVGELVQRVFLGDSAALVNHLLREGEIAPEELARLKRLIEARQKDGQGRDGR
ncbi:MAG: BlaI/MecI/CopY family transcriptional regulator [Planctomycetota bacterium]|nr:MAG: BlaI/MecI/CopY family transcriptional regulator [Planctomycetota bacterium]